MERKKQEQFIIVLLDNKHLHLAEEDVTKGILNKSLVHPREVFASAIEHRAAALICVHNHPSGDPEPFTRGFPDNGTSGRGRETGGNTCAR